MYTINIYIFTYQKVITMIFRFFWGGIESLSGILANSKKSSTFSWMLNQTSRTNNPQDLRIPSPPTIPEGQGAQSLSDVIRFPVCFASVRRPGSSRNKVSKKRDTLPPIIMEVEDEPLVKETTSWGKPFPTSMISKDKGCAP